MDRPPVPWGKLVVRTETGSVSGWHSLVAHSADVAACFEALIATSAIAYRMARLAGVDTLPDIWISRLAACAFLHDFGKANTGFQARWDANAAFCGHMRPALALLTERLAIAEQALPLAAMAGWGAGIADALDAVLAHHGAPLKDAPAVDRSLLQHWQSTSNYDPIAGLAQLGEHTQRWFAPAFADGGPVLPQAPLFWHGFAGLIMLADWLGSDRRAFPYANGADADRMAFARARARQAVAEIGVDARGPRAALQRDIGFGTVSPHDPSEAQLATIAAPGPVAVLEAETGSGKTEAALARFARLFAEGTVDGLYFALPTRVAATALFLRVRAAVARMWTEPATRPAVVLAVPGYLRIDEAQGRRLPDFEVLWDDAPDAARKRSRWAAEHPKRYLAATIAVGTIDQALLGAIPVKHAHMRAASLMRSLLVVDEVHASDAYMSALLQNLLRFHRASGGETLLLSATLGSAARTRLLAGTRNVSPPPLTEAEVLPYPAVWSLAAGQPHAQKVTSSTRQKAVRMIAASIIADPEKIAARALALARQGAKVLVVRNTVRDAIATARALHTLAPDDPVLFRCNGVPTLHHGRYAREDRVLLDATVDADLGRNSGAHGLVLIGTQTLEQSLDIDADAMLTDLCPADVLLQRLGRLHRHAERARPTGFEHAVCTVLCPPAPANFATWGGHGIGGQNSPYPDRPVIAATRRLIARHPVWKIPEMARLLVERATHPEALSALALEGPEWRDAVDQQLGRHHAARTHGMLAALDWSKRLSDLDFDDRYLPTRLGARDLLVRLDGMTGPFGAPVSTLAIPAHLLGESIDTDGLEASDIEPVAGGFRFRVGTAQFQYSAYGLERTNA